MFQAVRIVPGGVSSSMFVKMKLQSVVEALLPPTTGTSKPMFSIAWNANRMSGPKRSKSSASGPEACSFCICAVMSGVPNGTISTAVISRPSCGKASSQAARLSSQYGPGPVSTAYFVCPSCGSRQAMLSPCT